MGATRPMLKRVPLHDDGLLSEIRDPGSVEIALVERDDGSTEIKLLDAAFAAAANLLERARTDSTLREALCSEELEQTTFKFDELAIEEAPNDARREAVRQRYMDEWSGEEPSAIIVVRDGALPTPPMTRMDLRWAAERLTSLPAAWKKIRDNEASLQRQYDQVTALGSSYDLTKSALEPGIADELARLNEQATLIDKLEAQPEPSITDLATASAKRRFLLLELHCAGLLDEHHADAKRAHLDRLELTVLRAYYDAAVTLREYLGSAERLRYLKNADPDEPIMVAPISIDWFRKGSRGGCSGPGLRKDGTPFAFLTYAETCFDRFERRSGGFGEIFTRAGGWSTIRWRTDDGVHAKLLSLTAH